jgi:hypothetical protein
MYTLALVLRKKKQHLYPNNLPIMLNGCGNHLDPSSPTQEPNLQLDIRSQPLQGTFL